MSCRLLVPLHLVSLLVFHVQSGRRRRDHSSPPLIRIDFYTYKHGKHTKVQQAKRALGKE